MGIDERTVVVGVPPRIGRERFASILRERESPAAAEAEAGWDAVVGQGVDPLFALAIFHQESQFGIDGICFDHQTRSPGNTRTSRTGIGEQVQTDLGPFVRYPSWAEGWRDLAFRLVDPTFEYHKKGLRAIRPIIETWAPRTDFGNDPDNYIKRVVVNMNDWMETDVAVEETAEERPVATPTIFDIRNNADAERFFLSTTQPTPNSDGVPARDFLLSRCIPNRNGGSAQFIVLHVQEGVTVGSLEHWTRGVDEKGRRIAASATVMIQKDGSILRVITEEHGPWTNGDINNPTAQSAALRALGPDPNDPDPNVWTLSIEAEGFPRDEMPQAQVDAIVFQVRDWMTRFGIPLENVLPHSSINSVTRHQCPGGYYRRVIEALGGTVPPDFESGGFATPVPPPPFDGEPKKIGEVTFNPFQRQVTSLGVNRRKFATTSSPLTGPHIPAGVKIDVLYWVEGEAVDGNNVWLIGESGSRIWSGGVEEAVP